MAMAATLILLISTTAGAQSAPPTAADAIKISEGSGSFIFVDKQGDPSKKMTVYTYLPQGVNAARARIVFVMHGASKNADKYRDVWIEQADRYKVLIVAPLFDSAQWKSSAYSYPDVLDRSGKATDKSKWSFSAIEHLFDAVNEATGNQSPRYYIYGHSEGGQFVHRLVLFLPDARYARAVAANPGWYTMPDIDVKYPYGLNRTPVTQETLKTSLGRDFVLMLGDQDTDPDHAQLRKTDEAMAQGAMRFERGQNYIKKATEQAAALKTRLAWRLRTVHGAAHENSKMARAAAPVLLGS